MENIFIHSFTKNESEEIRMYLREYKGRLYADFRLFYQPVESAEFVPSKKGITISVEFIPELKRGFLKLEAEVKQRLAEVAFEKSAEEANG